MTSNDPSSIPRMELLKVLGSSEAGVMEDEKLLAIFDEEMLRDLSSLLDSFQTTSNAAYEPSVSDAKFKAPAGKVAKFTFLSKESMEKMVIKPFLFLNPSVSTADENEITSKLLQFYYDERLATIKLAQWLFMTPVKTATSKPEIIMACRALVKSIVSMGLIDKTYSQLLNAASIDVPRSIVNEGRNDLSFLWIHQNVLEQRELALLLFYALNCDFIQVALETRTKILLELPKGTFGMNSLQRYNLDAETLALARESFWIRQCAALRAFDLKGIIEASVSSQQILTNLNPIKTADLLKIHQNVFKSEISSEYSNPFKLAWALMVGFLDLLEVLNSDELRFEYPKLASKCIDSGAFKVLLELLEDQTLRNYDRVTASMIKSLVKDVSIAFFTVFESERSTAHIPLVTEVLIKVFMDEPDLCEEFWFVDSQYSGRTSILHYWIGRFPHDFVPLLRLLRAFSASPSSAEIVADFLFSGFGRIYVERSSDRGHVLEEYDNSNEVYNLLVSSRTEIKSCGLAFMLESGATGVMGSAFNERPMVHWNAHIDPFHFLLRILQASGEPAVGYCILDLMESLLTRSSHFSTKLFNHLEGIVPLFENPKVPNLPVTLIEILLRITEQSDPNPVLLSKSLNCLGALENCFNTDFLDVFTKMYAPLMDGITRVLKKCIYCVEIEHETFNILESILKFSESILNLCDSFASDRPVESALLAEAMNCTVFAYFVEHVGKWKYVHYSDRIRLLHEVSRLVLAADQDTDGGIVLSRNFSFLNSIVLLIRDISQDSRFANPQVFLDANVDVNVFFSCLSKAISSSGNNYLAIAEFFGQSSMNGETTKSPFNLIASCLSREYLILPVLLFFQFVFQEDPFAMNVRISRESLETVTDGMKTWFNSDSRSSMSKVRSASLAVLNNAACTRPDVFLALYARFETSFVDFVIEGMSRLAFDHEVMLISGICSVFWASVSDFSKVISALKGKSESFINALAQHLAVNWAESNTPTALKTISSILEILSAELCYFNSTDALPNSFGPTIKSLDPLRFIQKVSLFREEFPDSFFEFVDSFNVFAFSCLALKTEASTEFGLKLIAACSHLIELLPETLSEATFQVLNFGFLQIPNRNPYSILGHEAYSKLFQIVMNRLKRPLNDFASECQGRLEMVICAGLLVAETGEFKWVTEQEIMLLEVTESVVAILRRFLDLRLKSIRATSAHVTLLVRLILALPHSSELISLLRREGVVKTTMTVIRVHRDVGNLSLFTTALFQISVLMDDFVNSDALEAFLEVSGDAFEGHSSSFLIELLSLLSAVKIKFDSNHGLSDRISSLLYAFNFPRRLLKENSPCSGLLPKFLQLLQLLAASLENPIEAAATEAFLVSLLDCLLTLAVRHISSQESFIPEPLGALLVTLATFTIYGRPKYSMRKCLQMCLFREDGANVSASHHASALISLLLKASAVPRQTSSLESRTTYKFALQILLSNCPDKFVDELQNSLKDVKAILL